MLAKKELNICVDEHASAFKELFMKDGGLIIHPKHGTVTAVTCKLYPGPTCKYIHGDKGTKHNSALETTWDAPCVAVVRSESGGVTLYSTQMTKEGFCAHVDDHQP